jgi:hypothetical protein
MDRRELVDGPIGPKRPMHMIFQQPCGFRAGVGHAAQHRHAGAGEPGRSLDVIFPMGRQKPELESLS